MAKQIRAITYARIMHLLKETEKVETPNKLTLEMRSDSSGSIVDVHKTVIKTWDSVDELNELIKEVTLPPQRERQAGYYGR